MNAYVVVATSRAVTEWCIGIVTEPTATTREEWLLCSQCGAGGVVYRLHRFLGLRLMGSGTWRGGGRIEEFEEIYACESCGMTRRWGTVVRPIRPPKKPQHHQGAAHAGR